MDREDYPMLSSQSSGTDTALSCPAPRFMGDAFSDDEEDGWFDNLAHTPAQVGGSPGPSSDALSQTSSSSHSSQNSGQGFFQPSPALDLNIRCRPTALAPSSVSHDLNSQAFSPSVDEALEATTSHFPIMLDDDLACDLDEDMDSSRALFTATPVLSPSVDWVTEDSELLEFEFDVLSQGSLHGRTLSNPSSPRLSALPFESARVTYVRTLNQQAAASLRRLLLPHACSVSSAGQIPSALWTIDGDGQVGENEGSLVAEDADHATAIRSRLGDEACAGEGGGAGFLAEPTDMVLQWEGFDEGGNVGDMLWSE